MSKEREAFIYGYMQGSSDTILFGMEVSRGEAESAYDAWIEQAEIDPLVTHPEKDANLFGTRRGRNRE